VVANSLFVSSADTHEHRGCQTLKQRTSSTYFHSSSKTNPAVERNEDILTSGSEVIG